MSAAAWPHEVSPRSRLQGDTGTAMVEIAITAPLVIFLLLGIIEFGTVYRDYLTATDTVADGARTGSIQGPNNLATGETADYSIVATIRQASAVLNPKWIQSIVVFKAQPASAGTPLGQVPAVCRPATAYSSTAQKCNVYPGFDGFLAVQTGNANYFKCLAAGQRACGWNPETRNNGTGQVSTVIDYLGVYLRITRPRVTGLFGTSQLMEVAYIARLEPGNVL